MKRSDFDYALPPDRVAQEPVTPRDHSRLMVLNRRDPSIAHRRFYDLKESLRPGDVLVVNTTRVYPARLRGHKRSGGKVDVLLLGTEGGAAWRGLVRGTPKATELLFPENLSATMTERLPNGEWILNFSHNTLRAYLDRHGEMPLPPYIKRGEKLPADSNHYQTVFASQEGSIAAPTAGFHFTDSLLKDLRAKGVETVDVTLHVGWGTFRPVRVEAVEHHRMLPERYEVLDASAQALTRARAEGRRLIAVGTTSVRTLESIYDPTQQTFRAGGGETDLFIFPGYRFQAIDGLITNFHLPHSTPLFLACAFYSSDANAFSLRAAYHAAIQEGYRFYSYGDAMFIQ